MPELQPPNADEIKRQSVVRFLAEMQDLKQKIELEFSSRFDEQINNFLATSKASYPPAEISKIFDTIKSLELDYMKNILTNASGNGSKILGNTLSSALSGNLSFSGEATQRIAELEQETNRLKIELVEREKTFETERQTSKNRGEGQIGELNKLQEITDEQKRTIEMYEKQVMEHGESLVNQRMEIEDLQTQLGNLSQQREHSDVSTKEKEEVITEQKKDIEALKEQLTSMEKRVSQMKSVSSEKFEAKTNQLDELLNLERQRADELEVSMKEATTAINSYKDAVQQKDKEIDKLRKNVTDTKSEIASSSTEKDAQIKKLQDDHKALEHQLTDNKNSLERTEKKTANLSAELTEKEKAIDTKDDEIRSLRDQIVDAKDNVSSEKSSQEAKINDLLKEKTNNEAELKNLKKEIRDIKKSFEGKEKSIAEISKTQEVIEKDRNAIQEERDKIMIQLENLKSSVGDLEKAANEKEAIIKSLTKSLQGVPKFRVFLAIQDIGGEIAIKDLSKIVGQSNNVVEHIVSDLKEDGLVKVSKKENKTFVNRV